MALVQTVSCLTHMFCLVHGARSCVWHSFFSSTLLVIRSDRLIIFHSSKSVQSPLIEIKCGFGRLWQRVNVTAVGNMQLHLFSYSAAADGTPPSPWHPHQCPTPPPAPLPVVRSCMLDGQSLDSQWQVQLDLLLSITVLNTSTRLRSHRASSLLRWGTKHGKSSSHLSAWPALVMWQSLCLPSSISIVSHADLPILCYHV